MDDEDDAAGMVGADQPTGYLLPASVRAVIAEMADFSLLANVGLLIVCITNIFSMLGFYTPYIYLRDRAETVSNATTDESSLLVSMIGWAQCTLAHIHVRAQALQTQSVESSSAGWPIDNG
jgi:hypothetical protein